ncbi:MAG: acid phosphatase [Actinobacteria bacterium]|nr:MAG: acid phosphatase [Actinomycetota bacterium]
MRLLVVLVAVVAIGGAQARVAVPSLDHAIVIVFENKEANQVIGSRNAPTFNAMAKRYAALTRYYGVSHPSLPNYLALVSGSTQRITTDCTDCVVSARNLADTLEAAGKTWKLYAEGLPAAAFTGAISGRYAKKHAPFLYFRDVVDSRARLARIVPLTTLRSDVRSGRLPDFSFVVPNMCSSMHDCSVRTGDAWLRTVLPPLLALPNTAVFVVFDEGTSNVRGGGHVAALVLGTAVRNGSRFTAVTSHYGLLRTVEQAWGLPFLGRSARATVITGIWR